MRADKSNDWHITVLEHRWKIPHISQILKWWHTLFPGAAVPLQLAGLPSQQHMGAASSASRFLTCTAGTYTYRVTCTIDSRRPFIQFHGMDIGAVARTWHRTIIIRRGKREVNKQTVSVLVRSRTQVQGRRSSSRPGSIHNIYPNVFNSLLGTCARIGLSFCFILELWILCGKAYPSISLWWSPDQHLTRRKTVSEHAIGSWRYGYSSCLWCTHVPQLWIFVVFRAHWACFSKVRCFLSQTFGPIWSRYDFRRYCIRLFDVTTVYSMWMVCRFLLRPTLRPLRPTSPMHCCLSQKWIQVRLFPLPKKLRSISSWTLMATAGLTLLNLLSPNLIRKISDERTLLLLTFWFMDGSPKVFSWFRAPHWFYLIGLNWKNRSQGAFQCEVSVLLDFITGWRNKHLTMLVLSGYQCRQ